MKEREVVYFALGLMGWGGYCLYIYMYVCVCADVYIYE